MRLLSQLLAVLVVCAPASVAVAANTDPPAGGGTAGDYLFAEVQYSSPPGKNGRDGHGCTWTPVGEAQGVDADGKPVIDVMTIDGTTYRKYVKACGAVITTIWVPQLNPTTLAGQAARRVEELIPLPTINSAPPLDRGIVNFATWFWTDRQTFRPISAFAWIPTPAGPLSVLATATPAQIVFDPGEPDGQSVSCAGPGRTWQPGDSDTSVSECMYTYQHSSEISPTDTFQATLTVEWTVTWRSSAGTSATLPTHLSTSTQTATIHEIQTIVVDS